MRRAIAVGIGLFIAFIGLKSGGIIIAIPLTYSITNGIGLGFISFVVIKLCRGKFSEIKPLMWVASVAFLLVFLQAPLLALVSK